MTIDAATPRSRRALLFGALGGAVASVAAFARPATTRAGVDGDLVLEAVNTTTAQTELQTTAGVGFKVVGGDIGLQGWADIGVDAYGTTIALNAVGDGASAPSVVGWNRANSLGQLGWSTNGTESTPSVPAKTGVYGLAEQDAAARGVLGVSPAGQGVRGESTSGTGVAAVSSSGSGLTSDSATGHAIRGTSTSSHGIRGRGQLDGVIGESPGARSGVVGYSGGGSAPAGPGKTGVYGEATQDTASRGVSGYSLAGQGVRGEATTGQGVQAVATTGSAVKADATSGLALLATSTLGTAIRGHGQVDGIVGESPANSGLVGFSGAGSAPAGPAATGVYGESNLSSSAAGVSGKTTIGQGVRGQATSGIGVRAQSSTGYALFTTGKVKMDRSGQASVPANQTYVDVTVPGGVASTALGFANLQIKRTGVYVVAVRPAYPTATQMRIYLNAVASKTSTTPVAWMVLS